MVLAGLNVPAALVGGLVAYAVGALWYSPLLFGRAWQRAVGKTDAELQEGSKLTYPLAAFAWLVMAFALGYLLARIPLESAADGLLVTLAAWLLPGAATLLHGLFSGRGSTLWTIDAGYTLVGFLAIGATVVYWP